jgi:antitoxin VapB
LPHHPTSHFLSHKAAQKTPLPRPTARVGWNNRVQTVSIPVGFRFPESVREVFIRPEGESVILTPRPSDWSGFFASDLKASADFMVGVERLPVRERSF